MKTILFHPQNEFCITKNNGEVKIIGFGGHKVGLYYKLYSIQRKSYNYSMRTAGIYSSTGKLLIGGCFSDIMAELIQELAREHKYCIEDSNSDGGTVIHWRDDEEGLVDQLQFLKEKYTTSGDPRLYSKVKVFNNQERTCTYETLEKQIEIYTKEETKEAEFGVYLSFEEVLAEMRPLIMNGTDKEKIEAKAILAYVATKLAEK